MRTLESKVADEQSKIHNAIAVYLNRRGDNYI